MLNADLKDVVLSRILPNVKTPAQYLGGELNSTPKDHGNARGTAHVIHRGPANAS